MVESLKFFLNVSILYIFHSLVSRFALGRKVTLSQPNLTLESKLNFLALANRAVALQEEAIKIREFIVKEGETLRRDVTLGIPRESVLKLISGRGLRIVRKKWESRNSLMSYVPLVKQLEKKWGDLQLQLRTEGEKICVRPWPLFSDAQTQTTLKERDRI
ncbi:unnamed protein product [Orchesella dallaii]|uniref:Uncharacterized protein n=1 Tax=Orchesella dallaii TaxID=48710 RepID=A0ABP1S703_9HEXA